MMVQINRDWYAEMITVYLENDPTVFADLLALITPYWSHAQLQFSVCYKNTPVILLLISDTRGSQEWEF